MKKKRTALLTSILALLLCVSMLVGTTFAWFTDSVSSGSNVIAAGVLDVELEQLVDGKWIPVNESTNVFDEDALWEPGYTQVVYLRVRNAGDLALKYQLGVNIASETGSVNVKGNPFVLSDYIEYGTVQGVQTPFASREAARAAVTESSILSNGYVQQETLLPGAEPDYLALVVFMPETVENDANYATGAPAPQINLGIQLTATQQTEEIDSFDNQYDTNAAADFFPGFQGGAAGAVVAPDDQGLTTAEVAMDGGDVSAVIPAGVQVTNGASSLALSVTMKDHSEANIQLGANEEMRPLDVHIEGVAEGNTTPMLITLKHYLTTGINTGALKLYHVENGAPVAMTQVINPVNHNEFSYDPATGDVTLALASFSEVAVVADTNNPWDGETETAYSGSGTEADPYLIANADQLAYFRTQVDKGNTFEGKIVKLNNNIYLSGKNFDPIGWGYDYDGYTPDGKTFNGTFDGDNHFIFDLKQDGWALGYSYSMAGGGLFASVVDATIKNLKISGANIRMECIDMGVLVGYSQGNCTYSNIDIYNSKIANYQRSTGGVVGEVTCKRDTSGKPVGESVHTFDGVRVHNDVVVGTLWGDFDAACGGVIGGRWDDNNTTKVVMKNVEVRCRLDVYNDATAAYQWHAYRRAGMLIGNTDLPYGENRLAQAPFLTCENVDVYYGDWVNYTYCCFTNQSVEWQNNYPWVRVQAGENNSAYSNPRYGHPVIDGNAVTNDSHTHEENGDECHALRQFKQLYGGGQGVYGQHTHPGVNVKNYVYSISYVNDYKVLDIQYVTDNSKAVTTGSDQAMKLVVEWADKNIEGAYQFNNGWMNAGSTKMPTIPAGNEKDIVLYPYFDKPYTARFVDHQGNVIAWCFFHEKDTTQLTATKAAAEAALPGGGDEVKFEKWEVHITDDKGNTTTKADYADFNFAGSITDVTIYPVYKYEGDVQLIPVDGDGNGTIDYYQVGGYSNPSGQALVRIPGEVLGIKVTEINANAFSSYDGVHSIVIPNGVTIKMNAFTEGSRLGSGEEITIYFEGTKEQWNALAKNTGWDYGIGNNSRVFFLKDGKVDTTQGYLQVGSRKWNEKSDFASVKTQYTGYCDCKERTTGDTAHTYVRVNADETETIMLHNANGTPVNEQGVEIYWGVVKEGWLGSLGEEKGLRDDDTADTYKRYRPDAKFWN